MCLPAAVAAVAAAGTGYDLIQQRNQIKAANAARSYNRDAAVTDARESYKQLAFRNLEERERTAASIASIESQARRAASLAAGSAGASGVSGRAVEVLLDDFKRQELTAESHELRSLSFTERSLRAQAQAVKRQTAATLRNNVPQSTKIDYLGAVLRIGGSALGGYTQAGGRF